MNACRITAFPTTALVPKPAVFPQEKRGNVISNLLARDNFVDPFGCGQSSPLNQNRFQAVIFVGPERLK